MCPCDSGYVQVAFKLSTTRANSSARVRPFPAWLLSKLLSKSGLVGMRRMARFETAGGII